MAKKNAVKKADVKSGAAKQVKRNAKNKSSLKRELISPNGDARYVRRDKEGQFKESDDAGRSQKVDRLKKAKRVTSSGEGDKGDRQTAQKQNVKQK